MPSKDRIGSYNGRQLHQRLAAKSLTLDGQHPPLIVTEENLFPAHLLHQHSDLGILEFNDLLLLAIDPACENQEKELPRLQNKSHESLILKKR